MTQKKKKKGNVKKYGLIFGISKIKAYLCTVIIDIANFKPYEQRELD